MSVVFFLCRHFKKTHAAEDVEVPVIGASQVEEPAVQKSGLVPSDAWHDGEEVRKKPVKTDSQKKEKRQRTLSLNTKKAAGMQEYKGAEMEGFLERKHELQKGKAKATLRSWKSYYTVLVGQLVCFFKDEIGNYRKCFRRQLYSVLNTVTLIISFWKNVNLTTAMFEFSLIPYDVKSILIVSDFFIYAGGCMHAMF